MAPSQPGNKTSSAHRSAFLQGEHRFDIVGYRARKDLGVRNTVRSADFQAGGCTWALICRFDAPQPYSRPRGAIRTPLQLDTIILQLVSNDAHSGEDVIAKASLKIDDPAPSGKKKKSGPRRWPAAVWRSAEPATFPAAARGYDDDDPHECTGTSYWELSVPDAFRESLYVRDDRLSVHCTVDVLQEEAGDTAGTKKCFVSVVPPPSIAHDLRKLLDESESKTTPFVTDVTFVVEQTEIRAHRLVLAMRSRVFAAELLGEMKEGAASARVTVDDMRASTFRAMLHFIYTDELSPLKPTAAAAGDLLVAADRYDLERLRLMCEKTLAENMDAASVMTTLMLVHGRDSCRQLEAACVEYMASNPDVVATEEYKELKDKCGAFVTDVLEKVWTRAVVPVAPTPHPPSTSSSQTPTTTTRAQIKSASMFNSSEVFSGTHEFVIHNFTSVQRRFGAGEYVTSAPFEIGGYDWIIRVFPSGEVVEGDEGEQYITIFLTMTTSPTADVWVSYCFRMDDPTGESPPVKHRSEGFYSASNYIWGVKLMDVATAKSYYVRHDGSLTVHCAVSVTKEHSHTIAAAAAGAMGTAISVPSSNIASHLERLLVSEQGSDVTFLVGDTELRAHRLVIAARAPVLHEAVAAAMAEPDATDRRIRMDDIEAQVFSYVLNFIYTDELPEHFGNTTAMARAMLAAADRFGLARMKAMCENILCEHVTAENAVATLKLADRHLCQGLKDFCIDHISQPHVLEKVMETKAFKDLKTTCPSLLEDIIIKISNLSSSDG